MIWADFMGEGCPRRANDERGAAALHSNTEHDKVGAVAG